MSIYKKLLEAKKEMEAITKDSTNPFFKSNYFDINKILSEIEPILQKHGLLLLQPIVGNIVISRIIDSEATETSKGEHIVSSGIELPSITDPQKLGSAITYYRRYTLQSLLGLQAEDDDGNTASRTINNPPVQNDKPWLNETNKQGEPTKEWLNIEVKVTEGTITNISQIRKHYKISKELTSKIEQLLK